MGNEKPKNLYAQPTDMNNREEAGGKGVQDKEGKGGGKKWDNHKSTINKIYLKNKIKINWHITGT